MSEWIQFMIVLITMGGFIYMHRSDTKASDKKHEEFRSEWAKESKEFHGKLVALEVDFKNFMKREEEKRTTHILKH